MWAVAGQAQGPGIRAEGGACGRGGLCLACPSKDCDVMKERSLRPIHPAIVHCEGRAGGGSAGGVTKGLSMDRGAEVPRTELVGNLF